jgi:hypothetical protein
MRFFGSCGPKDRLAVGERHAHPLADRVRVFARERENIGQEGFNGLVHRVSPSKDYRATTAVIGDLISAENAPKSRTSLVEPQLTDAGWPLKHWSTPMPKRSDLDRQNDARLLTGLLLMATILACAILVYAYTGHPLAAGG